MVRYSWNPGNPNPSAQCLGPRNGTTQLVKVLLRFFLNFPDVATVNQGYHNHQLSTAKLSNESYQSKFIVDFCLHWHSSGNKFLGHR